MKIKYFNKEMPRLTMIEAGDWCDLRVNQVYVCDNNKESIKNGIKYRFVSHWNVNENNEKHVKYCAGDVVIVRLGVAMQLPRRHEAELKPRSSTFAEYGFLLTNSVGCIDESYCGDEDEWLAVFYATRDGQINQFDRVCQFRTNEKMSPIQFIEVETLGNKNRNGYGSTGKA